MGKAFRERAWQSPALTTFSVPKGVEADTYQRRVVGARRPRARCVRSRLHDDLALDGLDSRRGLGRVQDCLQCRQRREVAVEMHGAVAHRYSERAGMKIRRLRDRLLNATFDIGGGRFCLRLDLDQVVDDTHPGELTDCALGGVSLSGGLDLSVQYDARVTDLSGDGIGDRSSRAS